MSPQQRDFLIDECMSLTLMATAQRGGLYIPGSSEKGRSRFQRDLATQLRQLIPTYQMRVADEEHVAKITALSNQMSERHAEILSGGRFRIGSCQKAVNLYLKYMWCLGIIQQPPPHCPFDRIVISKLREYVGKPWTKLDTVDEYRDLLRCARARAQNTSLAEWELMLYNDQTRARPELALKE